MKLKKVKVYIDYGWGEDVIFGQLLKRRLSKLKGSYELSDYNDLFPDDSPDDEENWSSAVIYAIRSSDIIIPILSPSYFLKVTKGMQNQFEAIISSKDKFLFPILYSNTDWSDMNWVVKSKLNPPNNKAAAELPVSQYDQWLHDFVKTIGNVIAQLNRQSVDPPQEQLVADGKAIFISHTHDDSDFAELLKLRLEKEEIDAWIDTERLKIGQDWREEIDQSITDSLAVIVIMTPEARKSEYVTYEWAYAWGKTTPIFPIMLKQTQLHPRLESLQYLDFTNKANRPWNDLIAAIKKLME